MVTGYRRLIACLVGIAGVIAVEITNPYNGGGISMNGYLAVAANLVAYFGGAAVDKFKNGGKNE